MSRARPDGPRIGDSVTLILLRDGRRCQYAALVTAIYDASSRGPRPAVTLAWVQADHWTPPSWPARILLGLRTVLGPQLVWSQLSQVQHRDNWRDGGGDDFGEHWCWPEEAPPEFSYTD